MKLELPTSETERPAEFVEAFARGLAVLEAFDAYHSEMTLSDIARRTGLPPAAVRRSLITLKTLGYVGQVGKRYYLRPRVLGIGSAFYFATRVDEVFLPELRALVEAFGDASSIATLYGQDVLYVAHYSVQRARRAAAHVGARYPAFATSLGRVLLAGLSEERLDTWLSELNPVPLTSRTVTDKSELRRIIQQVRQLGYASTVDELDYGVTALAVPIRAPDGTTVAAINTSGYTGLVTPEKLVDERLPELRAAAQRIAVALSRNPVIYSMLAP